MLDDLTIHIGDVHRALRPLGQEDRPEPVVARGEKFASLIERRGDEGRAFGREPIGVDEITRRIARKDGRGTFRREQRLALPDLDPARGAERAGMAVSGGDVRTDREKPDAVMAAVDAIEGVTLITVLHGLAERQARIPLQPFRLERDMLDRHAVHADETVAVSIEAHPILGFTVHELDLESLGMETNVRRHLQRRTLRMRGTRDRASAEPGGEVDQAVRTDGGGVDP